MTAIHVPSIHYLAILPVLILFGAAVALLGASALTRAPLARAVTTGVTLAAAVAALVVAFVQWSDVARHGPSTTIAHAIVLDGFSVVAGAVVAVCLAMATLVAHDWAARERVASAEYHVLALCSAAGAVLMAQANDLIVIFLGLEILSIGLYVLAAWDRQRESSAEAGLKYFLLGGFASAVFIYGAALVYGATGSTNLSSLSYFLGANALLRPGLLYAGGALLAAGFAFKVAVVPFHMWSPDVYEGAPTPVTGFMASIVKVGAFAAFLRVLISALGTQLDDLAPDHLRAGRALDGRRRGPRRGAAQRQAPARVLVRQPRRVHPPGPLRRRPEGDRGDALLPDDLRADRRGDLRRRDPRRGPGRRPLTPSSPTAGWPGASRCSAARWRCCCSASSACR